jgi:predicted nicotinamide N-methyase
MLKFYFLKSYVLTKVLYEKIFKSLDPNEKYKILELGAGTAVPSIFSAHLGHQVTITDIKCQVEFVKNILLENTLSTIPEVFKLHWENQEDVDNLKKYISKYDIIIGAEIVYAEDYLNDLVNVLREFSNEKTQIILSFKYRMAEIIEGFLTNLSQYFEWNYVEESLVNKYYPIPRKLKILIAKLK